MVSEREYFKILKKEIQNKESNFKLIKNKSVIENFEKNSGKPIGLLENIPFYNYRMDLYENLQTGKVFRYCHIEYPETRGAASLVVFHRNNEEDIFLIENNFRIFHNKFLLEIPRGFSDPKDMNNSFLTAIRELKEETNLDIAILKHNCQKLGSISPDSGISNNIVDIFLIEFWIENYFEILSNDDKSEQIQNFYLITENELKQKISTGEIIDSFTITAAMQYFLKKQ